jgi:hypothetical protein
MDILANYLKTRAAATLDAVRVFQVGVGGVDHRARPRRAREPAVDPGRRAAEAQSEVVGLVAAERAAQGRDQVWDLGSGHGEDGPLIWHVYGDVLFDWFSEYVVLESEATAVNIFEIDLIPGLFQTPAYSWWSMRAYAPDAADEVINKRAELRQARQRRMEDGPLSVWAIIDEAALHRVVGGGEVHEEQLNHLSKVVELPHVTLQVLPFGKGQHMAMGTAFRLLKFLDFPSVVYIENLTGGLYLDEAAEVERYSLVLDHLRATALDPQESVALIRRVIGDL